MKKYYHGAGRRGPYFEGWYLKYQAREGAALALIPALHIDGEGRRSASLQVLTDRGSWWLEYPGTEFQASEKQFQVRVGQNIFNDTGAWLHIQREGLSLHGVLRSGPFTPLRSDIMGPFRFLPGMECAHGVLSMGHPLEGTLMLNGERLDFSGGTGYVETDRGRSFPSAYLWAQCAWGGPADSGLMLAVASVPFAAGRFTGWPPTGAPGWNGGPPPARWSARESTACRWSCRRAGDIRCGRRRRALWAVPSTRASGPVSAAGSGRGRPFFWTTPTPGPVLNTRKHESSHPALKSRMAFFYGFPCFCAR